MLLSWPWVERVEGEGGEDAKCGLKEGTVGVRDTPGWLLFALWPGWRWRRQDIRGWWRAERAEGYGGDGKQAKGGREGRIALWGQRERFPPQL